MFRFLFRIAALVGIGYAATKLSKKENRERVVSEYNKVKEDPKQYAQEMQEKVTESAHEYQEKAKSEFEKVKEDPKKYAQDMQGKVSESAQEMQEKVSESAEEYQEKAKSEFDKVKEDPKGYSEDLQSKAKDEMDKFKDMAEDKKEEMHKGSDNENSDPTEAQEARFDDETPAETDVKDVEDADFDNNVLRDYEESEEELLEKNKDDHKTVITKKNEK